jgi:hypothetical protein
MSLFESLTNTAIAQFKPTPRMFMGLSRRLCPPTFMMSADGSIGFVADPRGADSRIYFIGAEVFDWPGLPLETSPFMPIAYVMGSPRAWAELAAYNLARAYKPEGVL